MIFVFPIDVWGVPLFGHDAHPSDVALFTGGSLIAAGLASEFIIGVLASLYVAAGGELLFGFTEKLAGSLCLATSLPTMLVGVTRYNRDRSASAPRSIKAFVIIMVEGSMQGAFIVGRFLGLVPSVVLLRLLADIRFKGMATGLRSGVSSRSKW